MAREGISSLVAMSKTSDSLLDKFIGCVLGSFIIDVRRPFFINSENMQIVSH